MFFSGVQPYRLSYLTHNEPIHTLGTRRLVGLLKVSALPKFSDGRLDRLPKGSGLDLEFGWKGRSNEGNDFGG